MALDDSLLLVVDIQKIKLARTVFESAREPRKQATHHGLAKRIEEKEEAWAFGNPEIENISAKNACRATGTVFRAPGREVFAGNPYEGWVEFDSHDAPEWILRGEQHRTAHAGSDIDEGEVLDRGDGFGPLPSLQERMKDRRRHAEVCGGVAIVCVAGFEEPPWDEAAGLNSIGKIERVAGESFFLGEARKSMLSSTANQSWFYRSHN
jgi:hypothetical protein